jgi:hypothetical protein
MNCIPEPTNDHERTIAEAIDRKAPASAYQSVVAEVVVSLPFDMSIADVKFLLNYSHWTLAHPVTKPPAGREIPPEGLKRSG